MTACYLEPTDIIFEKSAPLLTDCVRLLGGDFAGACHKFVERASVRGCTFPSTV